MAAAAHAGNRVNFYIDVQVSKRARVSKSEQKSKRVTNRIKYTQTI